MNYTRIAISLLISILLISCSEKIDKNPVQTKAGKIIDRHIAGIGGEKALANLQTRLIEGQVTDDRPYKGPEVTIPFSVVADNKGSWRFDSDKLSFGCDELGGWYADSTGTYDDPSHYRSKLGFVFSPAGFLNLERYFKDISFGRSMEMNYRKMDGLYNDRDLTYYALWFDRETGLIGQIGYHWNLKDYQEVDCVLIPHLIEEGRKGGSILYRIDKVQHNVQTIDSLLQRPE